MAKHFWSSYALVFFIWRTSGAPWIFLGELSNAGWLQELKAAAVAVVAFVAMRMFVMLAPDQGRKRIPGPAVVVLCALTGWLLL